MAAGALIRHHRLSDGKPRIPQFKEKNIPRYYIAPVLAVKNGYACFAGGILQILRLDKGHLAVVAPDQYPVPFSYLSPASPFPSSASISSTRTIGRPRRGAINIASTMPSAISYPRR